MEVDRYSGGGLGGDLELCEELFKYSGRVVRGDGVLCRSDQVLRESSPKGWRDVWEWVVTS